MTNQSICVCSRPHRRETSGGHSGGWYVGWSRALMEGRTRSSHRLSRPSTHRPALCAVLATSLYRHATTHLCFKPPGQLARGGRALIGASKPCEPGPPWSEDGCHGKSFPYLAVRGTLFLLTGPDDVEETPRRGRQPAFMGSEFYLPTVPPLPASQPPTTQARFY